MSGSFQPKLFRDPVHGDIILSELAVKLIDTPEFQRLDGIKQLGFAHYAYRGAKHTRFLHSIGTYWLARTLLDQIRENHKRLGLPFPIAQLSDRLGDTEDKKLECLSGIVSTAALLHDITHIPFGHTLEDEFSEHYIKHDAIESPRLYYLLFDRRSHIARVFAQPERLLQPIDNDTLLRLICLIIKFKEDITKAPLKSFDQLLDEAGERVNRTSSFSKLECEFVIQRISELKNDYTRFKSEKLFHPFMSDVISNTVCADLLDYIARDTHYTGLQSKYDIRILQYFIITRDSLTESLRLALMVIDRKGVQKIDITTEVLNLMRMRYFLAERVYYHKAKVAPSAMLARALATSLRPPDGNPYENTSSILNPRIGDEDLIRRMEDCQRVTDEARGEGVAPLGVAEVRDLGQMLRMRKIYKPCVVLPKRIADEVASTAKYITMFRDSEEAVRRRRKLEADLSGITEKGPHSVIIYCPPIKMQAKEVETRIQFARDQVVPLDKHLFFAEEVRQLNLKYQALWKLFVFIHPACFENEVVVSEVIAAFCEAAGIPERYAGEISPYGYLNADERERLRHFNVWLRARGQPSHSGLQARVIQTGSWAAMVRDITSEAGAKNVGDMFEKANAVVFMDEFIADRSDAAGRMETKPRRGKARTVDSRVVREQLVTAICSWNEFQRRLEQAAKVPSERDRYFAAFRTILDREERGEEVGASE